MKLPERIERDMGKRAHIRQREGWSTKAIVEEGKRLFGTCWVGLVHCERYAERRGFVYRDLRERSGVDLNHLPPCL